MPVSALSDRRPMSAGASAAANGLANRGEHRSSISAASSRALRGRGHIRNGTLVAWSWQTTRHRVDGIGVRQWSAMPAQPTISYEHICEPSVDGSRSGLGRGCVRVGVHQAEQDGHGIGLERGRGRQRTGQRLHDLQHRERLLPPQRRQRQQVRKRWRCAPRIRQEMINDSVQIRPAVLIRVGRAASARAESGASRGLHLLGSRRVSARYNLQSGGFAAAACPAGCETP